MVGMTDPSRSKLDATLCASDARYGAPVLLGVVIVAAPLALLNWKVFVARFSVMRDAELSRQ
jgi:hypothetical protein